MKFSGIHPLPAPRERVYAAITDPAVLQRIIDGCEKLVRTGENTYDAHLKIELAGMKGSYIAKIQLQDQQPPAGCTLLMEGKGGPGSVKCIAQVKLNERGVETDMVCDANVQLSGLIAMMGSRLIEANAPKAMQEFARKLAAELTKP